MISDTDWALLDARLNEIERSIGILQAYVDTSLKEKYHGADGIAYALSSGSLVDAGFSQRWKQPFKAPEYYTDSEGNSWKQVVLPNEVIITKIGEDNV